MLYIDHTDPRRIGYAYWQVGNYKTINKFSAIERANGDLSKIKFYCMDDTWDQFDCTKEPTESWDELMRRRAQQLRDNYQYVALLYSGGWDSHTVLMTYIINQIPLDEIIIWDRTSYIEDPELMDSYITAKKLINDYNLNTKLTVYEVPWDHHANIYKSAGEDYIYLPGMPFTFNQTGRILHHEVLKNFVEIKSKHQADTAVFIEAHDKPRVNLWENKWYRFYIDSGMYSNIGKGGAELFYHTPDMPELELKQAYMSIRYFEYLLNTLPAATPDLIHRVQSFSIPTLYAEWNRYIGRTCMANDSAIHGLAKTLNSNIKSSENVKLINYTKEHVNEVYNIYTEGLLKVQQVTGIDVLKKGVPGTMSKQYYMREFIPK
jgi:hypothetical protein